MYVSSTYDISKLTYTVDILILQRMCKCIIDYGYNFYDFFYGFFYGEFYGYNLY
jgi:hypothetical protein